VFGLVNNRCEDLPPGVLRVGLLLSWFGAQEFLFFNLVWRADLSEVLALLTTWNVPLTTFALPGSQNA
jgi:hypothetical protein